MIIDAHTHIGSHLYKIYKGMYPAVNEINHFIEILKKNGISKAITFPMGDTMYYQIDTKNYSRFIPSGLCSFPYEIENRNMLLDINMFDEDKVLIPFAMIDPKERLLEQIDFLKEYFQQKKLFGIKVHCGFTNTHILDIDKPEIIELLREFAIPILMHTDDDTKDAYATHIYFLAKKYPDINFCVAHMGKWVKEFWDLCEEDGIPKNLFIDTSPFYLVAKFTKKFFDSKIHILEEYDEPKKVFIKYVEKYPDNILWGSDEPFTSFRTGIGQSTALSYKGGLVDNRNLLELIDKNLKAKISNINTKRFLGITL